MNHSEEPIEVTFEADPLGYITKELDEYMAEVRKAGEQGEVRGDPVEAEVVVDPVPDRPDDGPEVPELPAPPPSEGGGEAGDQDSEDRGEGDEAPDELGELGDPDAGGEPGDEAPDGGEKEGEPAPDGKGEQDAPEPPPLEDPDPSRLTKMLNVRATPEGKAALAEWAEHLDSTLTSVIRYAVYKHTGIDIHGSEGKVHPAKYEERGRK